MIDNVDEDTQYAEGDADTRTHLVLKGIGGGE